MDSVNSVNESLYFAAAQSISAKTASQTAKKEKTEKTKKNAFSDALKKSEEEQSLIEEGFPVEIAGMQIEEAAIFLKDAVDIAGDKMRIDPSPSNFSTYRKKVTQFMRYIVKTNYEIEKHKRFGHTSKGKQLAPQTQIVVIDKKLDEMAEWFLHSHKDNITLLQKMDEIHGLIVDLMAR
jgi:uncharacterized protein YaaR (DUF327 family)